MRKENLDYKNTEFILSWMRKENIDYKNTEFILLYFLYEYPFYFFI